MRKFCLCMHDFEIYTDGGYSMKRDIGAFAYVILTAGEIVKKKAYVIREETNNRAELKAIIAACWQVPEKASVLVRSDSKYAMGVLSGEWKGTSNIDLIDCWKTKVRPRLGKVDFEWVKGHNGNEWNELCDAMCNEAVGFDLNDKKEWIKR